MTWAQGDLQGRRQTLDGAAGSAGRRHHIRTCLDIPGFPISDGATLETGSNGRHRLSAASLARLAKEAREPFARF